MSEKDYYLEMCRLNKYIDDKDLNLAHTIQGAGGHANGVISKPRFKTALGMLFHQYPLTEPFIAAIALKYGFGAPDVHTGGFQEVHWRKFVTDVQKYPKPEAETPPNPLDKRIANAMSQLRQMAEDSGLGMAQDPISGMAHAFQGAGGMPTGVIAKQKFFMCLTSLLFPQFHFTMELLNDIALIYANKHGPPDLRQGGYVEVHWRHFIVDLHEVPLPAQRYHYE